MKLNKQGSIIAGIVVFLSAGAIALNSCVHAPYVLPATDRAASPGICFERDIQPIFISNCAKSGCHNSPRGAGGYTLDNYADIVKKGIVPGNPAASKIWESVDMNIFGVSHMPINQAGLTIAELDLLRAWIVAGAVDSGNCANTCDSTNYTYSGAILPMIQVNCVGCHSSASATGGSLADYTSIKNAAVSGRLIGDISHSPGYNAMPLGGLQLSDCQVAQVTKWVAAGAMEN